MSEQIEQEQTVESKKTRSLPWSLLISILALLVSGFSLMHQDRQGYLLNQKQQDLTQSLIKSDEDFDALKQQEAHMLQQMHEIRVHNREMQQGLDKLLTDKSEHDAQWQISSAKHLLSLAALNAHWFNDKASTLVLLEQANERLSGLSESKILDIRKELAKQILDLEQQKVLDKAGLMAELDVLSAKVAVLPLKVLPAKQKVQNNTELKSAPVGWREELQQNMHALEKLVVVTRGDEDIRPLLMPLFRQALLEGIRMNFQEAQWALLRNRQDVYDLAIKQAKGDIMRIANDHAPETTAMISALDLLEQVQMDSLMIDLAPIQKELDALGAR